MGYSYSQNGILFHHSLDESPSEERFVMHAHENYELYCFLRGSGTYFVEGNEYALAPGRILIMRPGETHKAQLSPDEPYERMAIHFPQQLIAPFDPQGDLLLPFSDRPAGRLNLYQPEQYDQPFVRGCFESMTRPAEESDASRYQAIVCNLPPILLELRRAFSAVHGAEPPVPQSLIGGVVDYINRNLTEDLNLNALSARFFISKSYLNQQFRQATGTTVWNYILLKRLMIARAAIRDGVPVTDAFRRSGFTDYSAFYRRYRDRFGVSPKDDLPK